MRAFMLVPAPGWEDRDGGDNRIFRRYQGLGVAQLHIGGGLLLVFDRRGVWEWDGWVLRRWVEVTRVGLQMGGAYHPVQWYWY